MPHLQFLDPISVSDDLSSPRHQPDQLWLARKIEEVEALQLLLSVKTHELHEAMTVILGVSDFLGAKDIPSELAADLQTIRSQINYMSQVIKRLDQLTDYKLNLDPDFLNDND
ncbi:MAG: hypothetical protein SVT56_13265 [Chloroflexota bacterium]|nr:hypothetical protein [Chloroflexota bacterium]